jgi:hypothetical protein
MKTNSIMRLEDHRSLLLFILNRQWGLNSNAKRVQLYFASCALWSFGEGAYSGGLVKFSACDGRQVKFNALRL